MQAHISVVSETNAERRISEARRKLALTVRADWIDYYQTSTASELNP